MISKVREIIPIIRCGFIGDKGIPLYQCSSGNCPSCPKYHPHVLESTPRSNFPLIHFITNKNHTKCKIHGTLAQNAKTCQHWESQSQEYNAFISGKISSKKELTKNKCAINTFLLDHYEPFLQKYKYHHSLIVLLGKYHTKNDRNVQFKKQKNWFSQKEIMQNDWKKRWIMSFNLIILVIVYLYQLKVAASIIEFPHLGIL